MRRQDPGDPGDEQLGAAEGPERHAQRASWPSPRPIPTSRPTRTCWPCGGADHHREQVAFARQGYNDTVIAYNTLREVFPTVLIAGMFNFQAASLFEIEQAEQCEAPKVSFG